MTTFANIAHYTADDEFDIKVEIFSTEGGLPVCTEVIAGHEINETLAYAMQTVPSLTAEACSAARREFIAAQIA